MLFTEDVDLSTIELSILVPCLNEDENITQILQNLTSIIQNNNLDNIEIIVLDDSSIDKTYNKAIDFAKSNNNSRTNIRIVHRYEPRRGYGAVIRCGIATSRGKYCIPVSADMVDPIDLIPIMLEKMRSGTTMVQCNRYTNANDTITIPFRYKFYQSIWRFLIKVLLRENILDTTYSFKMFRRVDSLMLGITSNGFSISPEIFLKILLSEGRVEYVSRGQGSRVYGESKFSFMREGFGYSYVLMRAWLHKLGVLWF